MVALFEAAPIGLGVVDSDGVLTGANTEFGRLVGTSVESAINRPLDEIAPSRDHRWQEIIRAASDGSSLCRSTVSLSRPNGGRSLEVVAWRPSTQGANPSVTVLVNELPSVNGSSAIRETERARIAREIHDGLTQDLWLAKLAASKLAQHPSLDPPGHALCADLLRSIDAALNESRTAVMATSSLHEPTTTLAVLIQKQVEEFSDRFGIRADCQLQDVDKVPARMSVEILRIVQEALNNARKHANARRVLVRMELHGREVVVSVADDGRGFDPTIASTGYGRQSMQERAESLNGELTITSAAGLGTTVRLQVPVARLRLPS